MVNQLKIIINYIISKKLLTVINIISIITSIIIIIFLGTAGIKDLSNQEWKISLLILRSNNLTING